MRQNCGRCKLPLTKQNTSPSQLIKGGYCRVCATECNRIRRGNKPRNFQTPGSNHTFPCGCSGILPQVEPEANKFVRVMAKIWYCRVASILGAGVQSAKRGGYKPVSLNTPHAAIRKMMEATTCWRCGEALLWDLGRSKTPHLHHNHRTGEPLGFTHGRCNPQILELEIDRLKEELAKRRV
jgi:hypothetical protein